MGVEKSVCLYSVHGAVRSAVFQTDPGAPQTASVSLLPVLVMKYAIWPKCMWTPEHHSHVIVEHFISKPCALICCCNSLHSSGFRLSFPFLFWNLAAEIFNHKSINEVQP